ncbi:ribonuclease domain-containing protein [Pelomicrobium sp.]|jgi:ribonuclease T1|uniref:ribonuclease domain-containing protein n=1 Tax=Pelomicrobium sp. TaxID=2815319 RepID=UPI002FDEF599
MKASRLLSAALLMAAVAAGLAILPAERDGGWESPRPPEVSLVDLPPEARETLALIRQGGPFPYAKDGTEFRNREGRLPPKPPGYYREYTVPTPGARDRGARRIVMGARGEAYYTEDHYRSFMRIRE